ncbi:hypothetical protein [uncultured Christiangramia sp.]|uniref:hypothetical protein n=1 Tax=uncultured Christiangramia sp. TaxID=503836 RepID=UPI00261DE6E4|nr:hypothetical protein [uncultured Christiangramia sp.]
MPYVDIYNSYTPLMMYLNSIVYELIDEPGYFIFLGIQYLVTFFSAFIFYRIGVDKKLKPSEAFCLSTLLVMAVLSSDGTAIILEVYILPCVLFAYIAFSRQQFLVTGLLLGISFFFKQYGLLNFIPFGLMILNNSKHQKFKSLLSFSMGGLIPLAIFLLYFLFIEKVEFAQLLMQISGNGYAENKIQTEKSFFSLLVGAKVFLLLLLPMLVLRKMAWTSRRFCLLLLGVGINLLPVLIKNFPHYFILTFPYLFILYAENMEKLKFRQLAALNFSFLLIFGLLILRLNRYKNVYSEQLQVSKVAQEKYPKGSSVYLCDGYRFLYILNNYQNPVLEKQGYRDWFVPDTQFYKEYNVLVRDYCVDPERLE